LPVSLSILIIFTIICIGNVFVEKKIIDNLINELNEKKIKTIRKLEIDINSYKEYIGIINVIKLCRKYIERYQIELDKLDKVAACIHYHRTMLENHIHYSDKIFDAFSIGKCDLKESELSEEINISNLKDVKSESLYSLFRTCKENQVFRISKKDIFNKDLDRQDFGIIFTEDSM
jgi:hypothetical protein